MIAQDEPNVSLYSPFWLFGSFLHFLQKVDEVEEYKNGGNIALINGFC
jgi:hypothetical protein